MIKLPNSCLVDKMIPKNKVYNFEIKNDIVTKITWLYKISEHTLKIKSTKNTSEIQIIELQLKEKRIPTNILKIITKKIPYPILFLLRYEKDYCYAIKDERIYYTSWNKEVEFLFDGKNLDDIFANIKKVISTKQQNDIEFIDFIKENVNEENMINNYSKEEDKKNILFSNLLETNNQDIKEYLMNIIQTTIYSQIEERILTFISKLSDSLYQKNYNMDKLNDLYLSNYKYTAFTHKCLTFVINEVNEEKIDYYKNICLNGLTSDIDELTKINKILKIFSEMDYDEILYLQYYYYLQKDNKEYLSIIAKKISDSLIDLNNEAEQKNYENLAINNLENDGLLVRKTEFITLYVEPKEIYEITDLGKIVLETIGAI